MQQVDRNLSPDTKGDRARSGEVFALTWSDVDLERRIIRITAEKGVILGSSGS